MRWVCLGSPYSISAIRSSFLDMAVLSVSRVPLDDDEKELLARRVRQRTSTVKTQKMTRVQLNNRKTVRLASGISSLPAMKWSRKQAKLQLRSSLLIACNKSKRK